MQRMSEPATLKLTPSRRSNYDELADNAVRLSTTHQRNQNTNYFIEFQSQHRRQDKSFFYPAIFTDQIPSNEISSKLFAKY